MGRLKCNVLNLQTLGKTLLFSFGRSYGSYGLSMHIRRGLLQITNESWDTIILLLTYDPKDTIIKVLLSLDTGKQVCYIAQTIPTGYRANNYHSESRHIGITLNASDQLLHGLRSTSRATSAKTWQSVHPEILCQKLESVQSSGVVQWALSAQSEHFDKYRWSHSFENYIWC